VGRKVVVGYEGSAHARRALWRAADLAGPDGHVTVVCATPGVEIDLTPRTADLVDPPDGVDWEAGIAGELEEREHLLEEGCALVRGRGVETSEVGAASDPAEAIVDAARRARAELVVVGTRGRNPAGRLVLGSVSHAVLEHAPCDVVVVK
jgi:nucleotide-binding universal stress UspA family protein